MNCSKCGAQAVSQQKFCRLCGASLEMNTQPLPESATLSQLQSYTGTVTRRETLPTEKLLAWGMIMLFAGAAIGGVGKMLLHLEVVTFVGVLISLLGMFLAVYPYLFPSPRHRRSNTMEPSEPELQAPAKPPKNLLEERAIENIPSITERTTDLLTNSVATPKRAQNRESQE